jgi:hypothetical protein
MTRTLSADELLQLFQGLLRPTALIEIATLAGLLLAAWGLVRLLRGAAPQPGSIWFGEGVVGGVLFPVLALLLALLARWVLMGLIPIAVFRLVVPILVSLAIIRLTARVLDRAFPSSALMRRWGRGSSAQAVSRPVTASARARDRAAAAGPLEPWCRRIRSRGCAAGALTSGSGRRPRPFPRLGLSLRELLSRLG